MTESTKISATHLARCAFVYVRQSSTAQVEHHRESTERQYRLVDRAMALGWRHDQVSVIDQDLGITGSGLASRSGFAHMIAEVALGRVGIVLGLKGTMSEAELHVLRARLNGGIRNKAERGELRRGLPIGLIFGDADKIR